MSNEILMPASVSSDFSNEVPAREYILHVCGAKLHHTQKSGNDSIEMVVEIVSPDVVPDSNGVPIQVAGRKATAYIPISPSAGNFEASFKYLAKLQMLRPEGGFIPSEVIARLKQGDVFIQALVMSDIAKVLHPVTKEPVLRADGTEVNMGWRTVLMDHAHIFGRVAPPPGFVPAPF